MNTYIQQLIELVDEAISRAPMHPNLENSEIEEEYHFAEEFLQGKPEKIGDVVGIDKFNFPNKEKLTETQISTLLQSIENLLKAYNWEFMFPENVTEAAKYQFILDNWNSKHVHCQQGVVQIETCKFDENKCPFPGHCNVCHSFKCSNDTSHHLDKGLVDFSSLLPDLNEDEDESLREDVERFKSLIKEPKNGNFIAGIHNYCDGRCQKCDFTDKCSSYSLNAEIDNMHQSEEGKSDKQLRVILKATTEIIEEELNKKGLKVEDALAEMEAMEEPTIPKHTIEKKAESYAEKVKRWLESNQMELESRIVSQPDINLCDDTETITWFQLFIPAKINRAVNCITNDNSSDVEKYDAKGSAKIALIAIDECLVAWENLLHVIPKKEDSILNILRHLSILKNELEELVPDARSFKRPGFDE